MEQPTKDRLHRSALQVLRFLKWVLYSGATGLLVGAVASAFHLGIDWGAHLRADRPWVLLLLPLGGVAIVLLYRLSGMEKDQGTNLVRVAVREAEPMRLRTAPLIFLATILTHLVGGSAGREGAALQLGGSLGGPAGNGHVRHVRRLLRPVRHPHDGGALLHGGGQRRGDVLRRPGALHRVRPHRLPGGPDHGPAPDAGL